MGLLGCDRCGRWHLTTRSRRSCFWEHSAVPLNPLGSSATSWDGYWLEQQKRENARDRARLHVPMVPTDPIEAALTQWGNDQLDHVDDVEALDLLVASSVYGVNRDLRTTPGQWSPTNEYADYWGYGYNNEIDFAAREFFASVNIDLPQAVTLFRGHRMPANAIPTVDSEYVDRGRRLARFGCVQISSSAAFHARRWHPPGHHRCRGPGTSVARPTTRKGANPRPRSAASLRVPHRTSAPVPPILQIESNGCSRSGPIGGRYGCSIRRARCGST